LGSDVFSCGSTTTIKYLFEPLQKLQIILIFALH
jgi:hypothetical protein